MPRTDTFMRQHGRLPDWWTPDQCSIFDAKVTETRRVAAFGSTADDQARARRWLRRHGYKV